MKRSIALFALALAALSPLFAADPVTIQYWHAYNAQSPEAKTITDVLIPSFEKTHPLIKVKAVAHEWAELHKKVLVSAASGQVADVVRIDIAWAAEFQDLGILLPLDKTFSDFKSVAAGLMEQPLSTAKVGDSYYGLPLDTNTKILFINKTLFDAAKVSIPKTLDEFFATAVKLSGKDAKGQQVWGYGEPALAGWNVAPLIWTAGGDILDPTMKKASGYLNSAASVAVIQQMATAFKNKSLTGFNSGDIPLTDGYATGRYAMIIEGPWKFAELAGNYPQFVPVTALMPQGKGGSAQVLGGEDIAVTKGPNSAAAWEFAKFLTGKEAQVAMAKVGQIPVSKEAINSAEVKAIKTFAPFLEAIKTAKARPPLLQWPEIDRILTDAATLAVTGKKDVKQALDEAASAIDALLK